MSLKTVIFLYILIVFAWVPKTHGQAASNEDFILNLDPDTLTPTPQIEVKMPIVTKAPAKKVSVTDTLTTKAKSPYIYFGFIVPGQPLIRTDSLYGSRKNGLGISLFVEQSDLLSTKEGIKIPNTTCDNGTCTITQASAWEQQLTYGFGVHCDNKVYCGKDFLNTSSFRPLASQSLQQEPQVIMRSLRKEIQGELTFKLNLPQTVPAKAASTHIRYIFLPHF